MRFFSVGLSFLLLCSVTLLPFAGQAKSDTVLASPVSSAKKTDTVKPQAKTKSVKAKKQQSKAKNTKSKKKSGTLVKSTPEEAKVKLTTLANKKMCAIQSCLRPCKQNKEIVKTANGYIARYIEVNPAQASVDVRPANSPGTQYVGIITYYEHFYESKGETMDKALAGTFTHVKTRRMREMHRYDQGKWFE